MSTDLAVSSTTRPAVTSWDADYRRLVTSTYLKPSKREATGLELALFAEDCVRTGLAPGKQIYGIFRYDSRVGGEVMNVQIGIDGFRTLAARSGKYLGQTHPQWCGPDREWVDVWLEEFPPSAARVGVYLRGAPEPVYAVATWKEYVQTKKDGTPTSMWRSMPANQLGKCAEAAALRKACPAELSGMYAPEEIAAVERIDPTGSPEHRAAVDGQVSASVAESVPPEAPGLRSQVRAAIEHATENGLASWEQVQMLLTARGATDVESVATAVGTLPADSCSPMLTDLYALEPSDAEVVS